jgi:hypothetical protein
VYTSRHKLYNKGVASQGTCYWITLVLSSILAGGSAQVYSIQFHVIKMLSVTPSMLIVFSWYLLFFLITFDLIGLVFLFKRVLFLDT